MKRMNQILNILMGCCIGIFIGYAIFVYWDVQKRPDFYAAQSAPWYTSILIYGGLTVIILLIALVIKYILHQKMK